ncbi:MAG: exodeoxyribonuclease VII small subunit [Planctomycetota bacterium]
MSFEDEYRRLEEILGRLEAGELSLEDSLSEYEQGISALRRCRQILDQAELKIRELSPEPEAR